MSVRCEALGLIQGHGRKRRSGEGQRTARERRCCGPFLPPQDGAGSHDHSLMDLQESRESHSPNGSTPAPSFQLHQVPRPRALVLLGKRKIP